MQWEEPGIFLCGMLVDLAMHKKGGKAGPRMKTTGRKIINTGNGYCCVIDLVLDLTGFVQYLKNFRGLPDTTLDKNLRGFIDYCRYISTANSGWCVI